MNNEKIIIEKAKNGFNKNLLRDNYHKIHSDDAQLNKLIRLIDVKKNNNYLDLGTGNGYIAFELFKVCKEINVYGLDIAEKAIQRNKKTAEKDGICNITFDVYDGFAMPYDNDFFNSVTCRLAIHHFPNIKNTIKEIARILKKDGTFILSDCTVNEIDNRRFVDKYMQLKDDGHVKFYYEKEFIELFSEYEMELVNKFYSTIKFPRLVDKRYYDLLKEQDKDIISAYEIEVVGEEIFITLKVMNLVFRKICNGK